MCRLWADARSILYFKKAVYKRITAESRRALVDLFSVLVLEQQRWARWVGEKSYSLVMFGLCGYACNLYI